MRDSLCLRCVALLLAVSIAATPVGAHAFSVKGHIVTANQALLEVGKASGVVWLRGFSSAVPADDQAKALEAIAAYPSYFRAGALGPDFYPDLIGGQIWVHPNRGRPLATFTSSACQATGTCIPSSLPMQERTIDQWRSSDYGMYLLHRATRLPNVTSSEQVARKQALAFAYGYLSHMLADGFSHAWVNEWTGDTFDIVSGGGIFGTITEEVKHVAVEKYLDRHMKQLPAGELTVTAPTAFLNAVYSGVVDDAEGPGVVIRRTEAAGAFAGAYFEELVKLRDLLVKLRSRSNWEDLVDPNDVALKNAVHVLVNGSPGFVAGALPSNLFLGFAGETLDPLASIELYFTRRAEAVDALAKKWVELSGCVAQNLAQGANQVPNQGVPVDACRAIDFEGDTGTTELFNGKLNAAAWWSKGGAEVDHGSLSGNLRKMEEFVKTVAQFGLSFSLIDDLVPLHELFTLFGYCDQALLDYQDCASACAATEETCVEIVTSLRCFVLVACFLATDEIIDAACASAVAKAAPLCGLCTDSGVGGACATLEAARQVAIDLPLAYDLLVKQVLQPAIDRAVDKAKQKLLEKYAGPYADDFIAAYEDMELSWKYATPAWMVNVAFLQNDLRADPTYMNRLVTAYLGISGNVVSNVAVGAGASADAIAVAVSQTSAATLPAAALKLPSSIKTADYGTVWNGLLTVLYQTQHQPMNLVTWLNVSSPAYAWLDSFTFTSTRYPYQTRLAKFMLLMAELQRVSGIRGPTVLALRAALGLDVALQDPRDGTLAPTPFQLHQVHATHNTIEATKVGLISPSGLTAFIGSTLGATEASVARPATETSAVCARTPHTACDVVKSLDDPSNIRGPIPTFAATSVDPELGVARWYSNKYNWSDGRVWQAASCSLTQTYFPLAYTQARAAGIYDKVFRYPPTCPQPGVACTPTTCEAQGKTCGVISDGCNGGWIGCGTCAANQVCMGTNTCCTRKTRTQACGTRCEGTAADGCGGTVTCFSPTCARDDCGGAPCPTCATGYQNCDGICLKVCP